MLLELPHEPCTACVHAKPLIMKMQHLTAGISASILVKIQRPARDTLKQGLAEVRFHFGIDGAGLSCCKVHKLGSASPEPPWWAGAI